MYMARNMYFMFPIMYTKYRKKQSFLKLVFKSQVLSNQWSYSKSISRKSGTLYIQFLLIQLTEFCGYQAPCYNAVSFAHCYNATPTVNQSYQLQRNMIILAKFIITILVTKHGSRSHAINPDNHASY